MIAFSCGEKLRADPGGYQWTPTFSNWLKIIFGNFGNVLFLAVFNFQGHFEGLNEGFLG